MSLEAIISVPHSGTHAVWEHLGLKGPQLIRGGRAIAEPGRSLYGHSWHLVNPVTLDEWVAACEGRQAYMPVRDPALMAWSYVNTYRTALEHLITALTKAVAIIKALSPIMVDIRTIPVKNHKARAGNGRDEVAGEQLTRDFPDYFGAYYGR